MEHTPTIEELPPLYQTLARHVRPDMISDDGYLVEVPLEAIYSAMQEWASIETEQLRQYLESTLKNRSEIVTELKSVHQENKTLIQRIKDLEEENRYLKTSTTPQ